MNRDELEREVQRLRLRLSGAELARWRAERARLGAVARLARAHDYLMAMQPAARRMRATLAIVATSKFWSARNAWFAFKRRLRPDAPGPLPIDLPPAGLVESPSWSLSPYERWLAAHEPRPADLARMRSLAGLLPYRPLFSVVMPVFEPQADHLRAAVESVIAQTYPFWELCIADDASPSAYVGELLRSYEADARIIVTRRERNGHIAAAGNTALATASGEFVTFLDHDDVLAPDALFELALALNHQPELDVIYSDEDKIGADGAFESAYFKPDWSPDSLLSRNYVNHLVAYRRSLVEQAGGFREGFEGSQDYDLLLRVTERTGRIAHIARILYHWRTHEKSTAAERGQKGYALDAARRALEEALERRGEPGVVLHDEQRGGIYTVRYAIVRPGRVSIVVPTRDHGADVDICLRSIVERSTYPDWEIVLLDNGSRDPAALEVFARWQAREPGRLRVVRYDVPFNYSAVNNFAVQHATGDYLLFLNNDCEVITPDWIEAMLEQAQRPSIGAVGVKLLYDDRTVQHAGVIVGLGGVAGHSHKHFPGDAPGYFYTLQTVNNFSAVTGACLMMRSELFRELGGFDEELAIAFNDVDLCLRLRERGYYNVYLPHVELYHHESRSRGVEDTPEKQARFLREQHFMHARWATDVRPDPHYNVNLTLDAENFALGM